MSRRPGNRRPNRGPRTPAPRGSAFGIGRAASARDEEPSLHRDVERILDAGDPLRLIAFASTMAAALEPRGPLEPQRGGPELAELVSMFRATGERATDALLLILKEFLENDVLARRISAEVAGRRHPLPAWLLQLDRFRPTSATMLGHVLGDGENVVIGVDTPAGPLTLVLYIDHNLGTVVKDGFVTDDPAEGIVARFAEMAADAVGTSTAELSLADARARAEQAIAAGRITHPPFETDTWPAARPMIEWMLRRMPAGGEGYPGPGDHDYDIPALVERLASSPLVEDFDARDGSDDRDIAETLMEFAENYFDDPLRWTPVTVETMLADLFPRKVHADRRYLARVPDVMRDVVVFAHGERGIPGLLTVDTLAAVDEFEPDYREATGAHLSPQDALVREFDPGDPYAYFKALLAAAVGGIEAMDALDVAPLSPSPLRTVEPDIQGRVEQVTAIAGNAAAELFDPELRIVVDRLVERIATSDPAIFRRNSKVEMTAAAVLWIAVTVNDGFRTITVKDMMGHLGLKGSPSQRAEPMLRALGVAEVTGWSYVASLGDPALLTSARRRSIRERWERLDSAERP